MNTIDLRNKNLLTVRNISKVTILLLLAILASMIVSCTTKLYSAEELHQQGANLTKITRKVKVAIRKNIPDDKLHKYINEKYPDEMAKFIDYLLIIKNHNGTAVVLMCDKQRTKALLEDISCTGSLEGGYIFQKDLTCDFHLDVEKECN